MIPEKNQLFTDETIFKQTAFKNQITLIKEHECSAIIPSFSQDGSYLRQHT